MICICQNTSVAGRQPPGEEVGMVARFQPPTKMVVAQFRIFRGIAGTFLPPLKGHRKFYTAMGTEICSLPLGRTRPTTLYIHSFWLKVRRGPCPLLTNDDSKVSVCYLDSLGTLFALHSIHFNIAALQRIDSSLANKQSDSSQRN